MMLVTSLNKHDVFSIIVDPIRNSIVGRLSETGKAAYSDLLDSAEHVKHLTSTGTFNYHLNFLIANSLVIKDGTVYKLTRKGQDIAKFLKDAEEIWNELEPTLQGERTGIFSLAKQFEEATGMRMQKGSSKFHGIDLITDERKVMGLISQEDCDNKFFAQYVQIAIQDFKPCQKECSENGRKVRELVMGHPDLEYHLSIQMFGVVCQFLNDHFGEAHAFAIRKKPNPFLFRAAEMGKDYDGCAFVHGGTLHLLEMRSDRFGWSSERSISRKQIHQFILSRLCPVLRILSR
jgi:hypothetical protein